MMIRLILRTLAHIAREVRDLERRVLAPDEEAQRSGYPERSERAWDELIDELERTER
ncbi:MAG: hypothetical protein RIS45_846, partial [Planctomycetota bacterium]